MMITRDRAGAVQVRVSDLSNEELFLVSIFAGDRAREAVQHELDRRATGAEVRRILAAPDNAPAPAAGAA